VLSEKLTVKVLNRWLYPNIAKVEGATGLRLTKGEAVVAYCEPLTTKEMRCPRLSRRVNNMVILKLFLERTNDDVL